VKEGVSSATGFSDRVGPLDSCHNLRSTMATYTPPPYFPQSSLAPPDKNRYTKFKLAMFALALVILLALGGIGFGIWYLLRSLF
jgi:hypothetical protein